ncbi:FUSC family protein [Methyloligella sp. 2.7D]|uniref:FUSC family protein n=1 Tax=unclassified Methyloligella TaxID=2625955 RepID=UPI00157DBC5B|nr:FUSC family protein [Methyloligella sp. GL2]QKP77246.1 FUSC family protein [Methyloligella sp. GL2]
MSALSWRAWVFAGKTTLAALFAFLLAMWFGLAEPYWALTTVFITSQLHAGATRSKSIYRVCGTLLGAVVSVIMVPNLINAPELLCLAVALWVGLCIYLSVIDRTAQSYMWMLAGYTVPLIAFPIIDTPSAIFTTAVARTEEITLGILCAGLASSLILPEPVTPAITQKLASWLQEAREWVISVFSPSDGTKDTPAERLHLASEAVALDALAAPFRHDTDSRGKVEAFANLRQHMLMFLPIITGISHRTRIMERDGPLPVSARSMLDDVDSWLTSNTTDPAEAESLKARIAASAPSIGPRPSWSDLLICNLEARLQDFIDLRQDTRALQRHIVQAEPMSEPLAFRYTAKVRTIRHQDHYKARIGAGAAVAAVLATSAMWILTGWSAGWAAPLMAALSGSFFADMEDPVPPILAFGNAAILSTLAGAVYLFAILPRVPNVEMLFLVMTPGLMACALLMTQPRYAFLGLGIAVLGTTTMMLQNGYTGDFSEFANASIALISGAWMTAILMRLMRNADAVRTANRYHAINRRDLVQEARRRRPRESLELAAKMLDRVGLIAAKLSSSGQGASAITSELLVQTRIGINLVELLRVRRQLSPRTRACIDRLLDALAQHFSTESKDTPAPILGLLDDALDAALRETCSGRSSAVLGLVGLRCILFADAPAYEPPALLIAEAAA